VTAGRRYDDRRQFLAIIVAVILPFLAFDTVGIDASGRWIPV
jgi:hypothetical protein